MPDSEPVATLAAVLAPDPDPVRQAAIMAILREHGARVLVAGTPRKLPKSWHP